MTPVVPQHLIRKTPTGCRGFLLLKFYLVIQASLYLHLKTEPR